MTQWRDDGWPLTWLEAAEFTASETAQMFRGILMGVEPEGYEAKQRRAALLMEQLIEVDE